MARTLPSSDAPSASTAPLTSSSAASAIEPAFGAIDTTSTSSEDGSVGSEPPQAERARIAHTTVVDFIDLLLPRGQWTPQCPKVGKDFFAATSVDDGGLEEHQRPSFARLVKRDQEAMPNRWL